MTIALLLPIIGCDHQATADAAALNQPNVYSQPTDEPPTGQGTKRVLAAQFYLSISLVGFTRVISFLFLLFQACHEVCHTTSNCSSDRTSRM